MQQETDDINQAIDISVAFAGGVDKPVYTPAPADPSGENPGGYQFERRTTIGTIAFAIDPRDAKDYRIEGFTLRRHDRDPEPILIPSRTIHTPQLLSLSFRFPGRQHWRRVDVSLSIQYVRIDGTGSHWSDPQVGNDGTT